MSDRRTEGAAALPAPADPTDPGYDVETLREHVRHLERRIRQLHAERASPLTSAAEGAEPTTLADARRYLWLREHAHGDGDAQVAAEVCLRQPTPVDMDAEIDDRRRATRPIESSPTSPQSGGDAKEIQG